jgi:3-methylcrotonyl-CoA carboxylase beta subunit
MFMWPNAKIGVMGSEQLSAVMEAVGRTADPDLKSRIDHESQAIYSSARLWDDGVIPPAQTRKVLGMGLAAAMGGKNKIEEAETRFGVFRM